jgi:hypothetical protein
MLVAETEVQTGEDELGSPTYGTVDVIGGDADHDPEPVRYDSGGTSYVRGDTGARIERAASVTGRPALARLLDEGDTVALDPLNPDASGLSDLEVRGINTGHGRRARAKRATIELEQH